MSAKARPDPFILNDFANMANECITEFTNNILREEPQPLTYLMDYPKEQKEWSDGKKATYEENIHRAFYDKTYDDYLCSFTLMVKSGEVNTTDVVELDHDGYLIG